MPNTSSLAISGTWARCGYVDRLLGEPGLADEVAAVLRHYRHQRLAVVFQLVEGQAADVEGALDHVRDDGQGFAQLERGVHGQADLAQDGQVVHLAPQGNMATQ